MGIRNYSFIGALAIFWLAGLVTVPAQTWTQVTLPGTVFSQPAISADGAKWATLSGFPYDTIWVSTNAGMTWASNNLPYTTEVSLPRLVWSADGRALFAGMYGLFYVSTNNGNSWVSNSMPEEVWSRLACSTDGQKLAAITGGINAGPICVSTNSGLAWVMADAPFTNWSKIVTSSDGSKLAATIQSADGLIYVSTNAGLNWQVSAAPVLSWTSVASSADGDRLIAVGGGDGAAARLYTSTNSGATWFSNKLSLPANNSWMDVASSADGKKLLAVCISNDSSGLIFVSQDAGLNWSTNGVPSRVWLSAASAADGGLFVVAGVPLLFSSQVEYYTFRTNIVPGLAVTKTNGQIKLSWPVPSTDYRLQQCPALTGDNWMPVTNSSIVIGSDLQDEVTLTPDAATAFFRLATP